MVKNPLALKENLGYLPRNPGSTQTMTAENYLAFFGEILRALTAGDPVRSNQILCRPFPRTGRQEDRGVFQGHEAKDRDCPGRLIHDPGFLVYDEATSELDPMTSRFIADYLRRLKVDGKTIVLSAHNLFQVEAICDKVMILRRGKMVAFGTMHELRDQFGTLTYTIFFTIDDPGKLIGHSKPYRAGGRVLRLRSGGHEGTQ